MAWWTDLIKAGVPPIVDMFTGKDQPEQGDQPRDAQGNLVTRPIPGELEKREKLKPWASESQMRAFSNAAADMARPVGATPALRSASPSELNSRYWAAIYEDARRRSEIR